jgi:phage baseplate assembly protein V
MADSLLEKIAADRDDRGERGFAIEPGVVKNNVDLLSEGRVQVRIPARPSFEPWARLASVGGADGRGFFWVPAIDDEVLVAFASDDLSSAVILGGLYSTSNHPPLSSPVDALAKKVIRTGATSAVGHELEFDDVEQSVTLTTSTKQKIVVTPDKIELTNLAGTVDVKLDNTSQTVSIVAAMKIELKAQQISMTGSTVEISGGKVTINSAGPCTVQGQPIALN